MKYDFKKQIRSFGYAWKGLRQCIGKEQNLSFHLITTIIVIGAGILFDITRTEWMIIILCIGMVVAAELFNTAIERLVDLVSPERHPIAGQVKDIAAVEGVVPSCVGDSIKAGLKNIRKYFEKRKWEVSREWEHLND